ncbi:hypothetical protein [Rhizorhabdus sp.]|uniref:hypothetical protein n=1 Tax=Rhizorhabdus sp. TaxID=1968843 RepID=UPI0025F16416|nr:hypothetical protein [Rhizorhabdus sp.]
MMGDVLEEDEGRLDLADDAGDMRPEVARIVRAPALARHGRPSKVATSSQTGAGSRAASSIRATRMAAA